MHVRTDIKNMSTIISQISQIANQNNFKHDQQTFENLHEMRRNEMSPLVRTRKRRRWKSRLSWRFSASGPALGCYLKAGLRLRTARGAHLGGRETGSGTALPEGNWKEPGLADRSPCIRRRKNRHHPYRRRLELRHRCCKSKFSC